jgi:hypothetical protein
VIYLVSTRDKGIIIRLDDTKELEVFCHTDFANNWDKD